MTRRLRPKLLRRLCACFCFQNIQTEKGQEQINKKFETYTAIADVPYFVETVNTLSLDTGLLTMTALLEYFGLHF